MIQNVLPYHHLARRLGLFTVPEVIERGSIEMPQCMAQLPVYNGFPVGFMFARTKQGVPDFKVIKFEHAELIIKHRLCGLCGQHIEGRGAVVGGPASMANRISSDPPFHEECARYAFSTCPHLLGQVDYAKITKERHDSTVKATRVDLLPQSAVIGLAITPDWQFDKIRDFNGDVFGLFRCEPWMEIHWTARTETAREGAATGKTCFEMLDIETRRALDNIACEKLKRGEDL